MSVRRLAPGVRIALDGKVHTIVSFDAKTDQFVLADHDGVEVRLAQPDLFAHRDLIIFGRDPAPAHRALDKRLKESDRRVLMWRVEHLLEVQTGYRSGEPATALPGEPRAMYDPATTTLTQRRLAKERELATEAAMRSGECMSYASLVRLGPRLDSTLGLDGVVDKRHVRKSPGRYSVPDVVVKACFAVYEETRLRSNLTEVGRYLKIKQWVDAHLEAEGKTWADVSDRRYPSESTIRRWHQDNFRKSELNGKGRTRRSATTAPAEGFNAPHPTRPGELVVMDSNSCDELLEGTKYEGAVQGVLVVAIDWFSRSVVSVRVVESAESAIDVSFAILDMMRPMPLRPGWGDELRWPFAGVPDSMIGVDSSARPVVVPEATVLDHGNPYKNHLVVRNQEQLGISILPARTYTGSDKGVIERFFGALKTGLLEQLPGFRGSDVSERGDSIDDDVFLDAQALEDLILWWCVRIWQNHVMDSVRPPWCPEGDWSPNLLYQHGIETHGISVRYADTNDYASMLDFTAVKIESTGIKVKGLTYDSPLLDPLRRQLAPYERGTKRGAWTVRYDRRDLRHVYLLMGDGDYHEIPWVGSRGDMPAFTDRHVNAMRRHLTQHGGNKPFTDEELRDILLAEVLQVHDPVEDWKSNGGRRKRPTKGQKQARTASKAESRDARQHEMQRQDKDRHGAQDEKQKDPSDKHVTAPETPDLVTEARRKRRLGANRTVEPAPRMGRASFFGTPPDQDAQNTGSTESTGDTADGAR